MIHPALWFLLAQVTRAEYLLLWATYVAIMGYGLEGGIGIGIIAATLYFAWSYAQVRPSYWLACYAALMMNGR